MTCQLDEPEDYETLESEPKELFSIARADSHLHLQKGAIVAEKPGKCKRKKTKSMH